MKQRRRAIPYIFAGAMVIAPFLGLIYDVTFGLGVLAGALAVTTYLALDAAKIAAPDSRRRLLALAYLNGALAVVAIGLVVLRVAG